MDGWIDDRWMMDEWGESGVDEGVLCGETWAPGGGQEEMPGVAHHNRGQCSPRCEEPSVTCEMGFEVTSPPRT